MRRFQKRPDVQLVIIPGVGRLKPGQIIEGDQYARYFPSALIELPPDAAPAQPTAPGPKAPPPKAQPSRPAVTPPPPAVIIPPPPPPSPAGLKSSEALSDTVETPIHVPPEARRPPASMEEAGFVPPEKLVAAVDAENRQTEEQIDKAVEKLTPVDDDEEKTPAEPKKKPDAKHHDAPKHAPKSGGKKSGRK